MRFEDVVNPTADELRKWAADPNAMYPDDMSQDFDLMVADWGRINLIVELASDSSCPNRTFFVGVLYLMAGDCVRTSGGTQDIPKLKELLQRLAQSDSPELQLFRSRALELLKDPSTFDYNLWCNAGYLQIPG
jgi:hypothetical protein